MRQKETAIASVKTQVLEKLHSNKKTKKNKIGEKEKINGKATKKRKSTGFFVDESDDNDDDGDDGDSDVSETDTNSNKHINNKLSKKKRKKSKHAPAEVSSKRQDFYRKESSHTLKTTRGIADMSKRTRDPRFEGLSSTGDNHVFQQRYKFLEDMVDEEIKDLKAKVYATKLTGVKGNKKRRQLNVRVDDAAELEEKLVKLKQQRANYQRGQMERQAKQTVKRNIRQEVEAGNFTNMYMKRKDKRKLEMEAKMEVIKKKGGKKAVDKVIAKKRKKESAKDYKILGAF